MNRSPLPDSFVVVIYLVFHSLAFIFNIFQIIEVITANEKSEADLILYN